MRRVSYDNFRTAVEGPLEIPPNPQMPQGAHVMVLTITDNDAKTIHEFTYPVDAAKKVGAALQGTAVQTVPAAAMHDLEKLAPKPGG